MFTDIPDGNGVRCPDCNSWVEAPLDEHTPYCDGRLDETPKR